MDEKTAATLRAPFPAELIGKRPQPTCRDCSQSRTKVCDQHRKSRCQACDQYITNAHIHLDFVGHADITDRFLKVDPDWSWEPLAYDERGLPAFDQNGGMWIKLTVAGTTRIGYGDAQGKTGPNAIKEAIGDALRNAGMRFGVGLDMWRKEAPETAETASASSSPQPTTQQPAAQPATEPSNGSGDADWEWMAAFEERVKAESDTDAVQAMKREVIGKLRERRIQPAQSTELTRLCNDRIQELEAA